jgi:hypothetical protein
MLCHQIWPSESIIHSITEVPVLFLSGLKDEIVPYVLSLLFISHASHRENDDLFPSTKPEPFWAWIKQRVFGLL